MFVAFHGYQGAVPFVVSCTEILPGTEITVNYNIINEETDYVK
jgi:hypothetical protein